MGEDAELQSPLSFTATSSSGGGIFSELSSATEHFTMSPTPRFVVTEALSKVYYKGLPSNPPLIATTNPSPFEDLTGPEAYSVVKELRELGDHPLASAWDHGLADRLRSSLNTMTVLRPSHRLDWRQVRGAQLREGQGRRLPLPGVHQLLRSPRLPRRNQGVSCYETRGQ
ncbi:uncharacterized protein BT62DRAFT_729093 [Guyanagaster necrorhizus]|uniref:Uncharacterized protein n=1 Tax=Guyanagaster necrorhizus TaxID=856835 RepID=A0A9P7VZU4_9AGAR|nr:uncharacterized protein BT62DRAFT_729093 [Guyanagaster necrorhizus MCA 3950]KAG7448811.1 hypothetical protein BT62DRAFT_729093 [Guyanagaster necrorhizus MCA 3950]